MLDRPAKCGVETRESVPGLYGGYFYMDTMEEGKELLQLVRKQCGQRVGHKVPVSLKKGCTEMEIKHGPSDKWDAITEAEKEFEEALDEIFDPPFSQYTQPEWLQNDIVLSWFDSAWENGDMSVMSFTGNQPIIPPAVTYE